MDFHEITCKGKIYIQIVSSLPTYVATDVGRILYVSGENRFYFGTSSGWSVWGSDIIPAGTKMVFYQNSAPSSWTIDATVADAVIAIKGGSNAYNVNGGQLAGTWTQANHTHSFSDSVSFSHSHAVTHNHQWTDYGSFGSYTERTWESNGTTYQSLQNTYKSQNAIVVHVKDGDGYSTNKDKYTKNYSGSTSSAAAAGTVSGTTGGSSTASSWRPYAAISIVATKD
jgi:hypothetical protein